MIAIARADDTKQVDIGTPDSPDLFTVPDIKLPGGVDWIAQRIPGGAIIVFKRNGEAVATLWDGPHTIPNMAGTYYIIDAPKSLLQALRDQLGTANVAPIIKALRASADLRAWAKAQGYKLVRNSSNTPISILPRIVICGQPPVDLDGDELDTAQELPDLE